MPKSPVIKGNPGPWIVAQRYYYDPGSGDSGIEYEYEGTIQAIKLLGSASIANRKAHQIHTEGGMGRATIRYANSNAISASIVRYEVGLEVLEQDIWTHPTIIAEAAAYNLAVASIDGARTYRQLAEDVAESVDTTVNVSALTYPNWQTVVELLRDGVTGWEKEYIVLKRNRRVPSYPDNAPHRVGLPTAQYVYSTLQLGVPAVVAFNLPDSNTLTPSSANYAWGWRRRPSQSVYDGDWIEQSSEFILAEWSTLLYEHVQGDVGASSGW